jgi:hypothetical protein
MLHNCRETCDTKRFVVIVGDIFSLDICEPGRPVGMFFERACSVVVSGGQLEQAEKF